MIQNAIKNHHLLWRAGFGPSTGQLLQLNALPTAQVYKNILQASLEKPAYLNAADESLKELVNGISNGTDIQKLKELDADQKKLIRQKQRDSIKNLNLLWLNQMVSSTDQIREKMAFFWHGHFASRNMNVFFQQDLLHIIRQNALGSFRDLLHEVSKSAAMLNFLNANQNRKDHPNENFAREVMELFTLGRGNYSENDVKEAARAFTGWGANVKGEFIFRKFQHDDGNKTVLGSSGNFDGDNVLDILLKQEKTARFISQKIYRFFVNDLPDNNRIEWLASRFYKSDYNISSLLNDIYTSDWFYNEEHIGAKIKSPVELLAGIRRMLPMKLQNEEVQLMLQRVLGQVLFYPPNVAGWPGGRSWIDSSTLMTRMRIPQMISNQDQFNVRPKSDDDNMMGKMEENQPTVNYLKANNFKSGKQIRAEINWTEYLENFTTVSRQNITDELIRTLLQVNPAFDKELINKFSDDSSRENYIKSATIQIMSTPEYQVC